jgi:hypothetical protein
MLVLSACVPVAAPTGETETQGSVAPAQATTQVTMWHGWTGADNTEMLDQIINSYNQTNESVPSYNPPYVPIPQMTFDGTLDHYRSEKQGSLTDEQIRFYDEEGYLVLPHLLNEEEIAGVKASLLHEWQKHNLRRYHD